MPSVTKTGILVKAALSGQRDKMGVSKHAHCVRVYHNALRLIKDYNITDEKIIGDIKLVALLHDILEDSDLTSNDLHVFGYSNAVIDAVELVTHETAKQTYPLYIDDLCAAGNVVALIAKLADNLDNTSEERSAMLQQRFRDYLNRKYAGVRQKLEAAIEKALDV
jgi:(p)ppGpp synthase/HD superfamily hydrolase